MERARACRIPCLWFEALCIINLSMGWRRVRRPRVVSPDPGKHVIRWQLFGISRIGLMTTPHERPAPRGAERTTAAIIAPRQQGSPAICGTCHSDQYLVYEEV